MKPSRFATEQIIAVLKRAEAGEAIVDICRAVGISDTTFARWRAKYGGMEVSDTQRLPTLEAEIAASSSCSPRPCSTMLRSRMCWQNRHARATIPPSGHGCGRWPRSGPALAIAA